MRTRRVYLAGPMRGYPDFNFPAFEAGAAALRARGFEVFSPAERDISKHDATMFVGDGDIQKIEGKNGFSLREVLNADLDWITKHADLVVVLPGWEASKGANAEVATARALEAADPTCGVATLADALTVIAPTLS